MMTDVKQDRIHLWFNRNDEALRGAESFRPVLERLENSFLPRPTRVQVDGRAEREVKGYLDSQITKGLDRGAGTVKMSNPSEQLHADIWQIPNRSIIGIFFPVSLVARLSASAIGQLFVDLIKIVHPTYARCHLDRLGSELHDAHYSAKPRSFYADGLYWLNFFGPEEERRQGGSSLANNPHARVERLPEGLLLEVGNGPLDAATPEGERQLLDATAAMPPLNRGESSPGSPEEEEAAELITINGVQGFFDKADNGFWVSKHLSPTSILSANLISKLKQLVGKGSPPINQVHVLFSLKDAAERNRSALSAAGVRAWYVDPQTGKPKEAR
jgi:hypothetical protein